MARAKLFPIDVVRRQENDYLRPPTEAAKGEAPTAVRCCDRGFPPGGLRSRFAPSQDPLKRDSHTLVRLCFIGKDARSKENHCDIFTTIKTVTSKI